MMRFYPALCSVTFRALTPAAIIELAAAAGLVAIEWGADLHVRPGEPVTARAVRSLTEANGLRVASYGSYWRPGDEFAAVIDAALALGAPSVRIWPGFSGRASMGYSPAERRTVADAIRAMADAAGRVGIAVNLEYHPKTLTDDLASARALLAEIDHRAVFTYWQPRPGLPLATALAEVAALAADISHLHVFEWDAASARYPLARGREYWREVFAAVQPGRWPGDRYAMLEFVADDDIEKFRADASELVRLVSLSGSQP